MLGQVPGETKPSGRTRLAAGGRLAPKAGESRIGWSAIVFGALPVTLCG
jgi:hypothetical protein